MPTKVLILGGTGEARRLAQALVDLGMKPTTSFAGVTQDPIIPPGAVRFGGFGGTEGLAEHARHGGYSVIVDATHPFADRISRHAAEAAHAVALPLYRLEREAWRAGTGDRWLGVADADAAAAALPSGAMALVTIGRKGIAPFFERDDIAGVARMIETPAVAVPPSWQLILARPPFTVEQERDLMIGQNISHLVTKNSGGPTTEAKLFAARALHLPVIMLERPRKPPASVYSDAASLAAALRKLLSP